MKTAVLINNYNRAAWLPECIDSVLSQDPPPDEVILYDDASSDDSLAIVQRYHPRITVIPGPRLTQPTRVHQGIAIHEAFRRSTADILFLLDSDDIFTPGKIARYLAAFSQTPQPVLVQAPMRWIDAHSLPLTRYPEPAKHTADPLATTYARHDPDLFYPTSALAFTRDFLARALPLDWSDNINLWSDTRLSMAAMLHGPVLTLHEEHGAWRLHTNSDSATQARARSYQLRQTIRRTQVFNLLARKIGRPPLRLWKNPRFYRQLARLLMPPSLFQFYQKSLAKPPAPLRPDPALPGPR